MRRPRVAQVAGGVAVAAVACACSIVFGVGEDAVRGAPAGDAGDGSPVPVVLATIPGGLAPTGNAQTSHVVWAAAVQQWWLFYVGGSAAGTLQTSFSGDFVTWTPGGTLTLPAGTTDGRDLAAAAAVLGGEDVVHLAVSVHRSATDREHVHARARITAGAIQFDPLISVSSTPLPLAGLDPDGPATAALSDGVVFDTTAWFQEVDSGATGNSYMAQSTTADPGGAFAMAFGPMVKLEGSPQVVNARELVPLGGGGVMALWEAADADPDPTNVHAASWSGSWSTATPVFAPSPQDPNDWGACAVGPDVHAVRYTSGASWQHRIWNGTSFVDGSSMPALAAQTGTGVVVVGDGARVHVFAIASDAGHPVRTTTFSAGTWSAWSDVVTAPAQRTWLSGAITPTGVIALAWTEATASSAAIVGALLP